MFLLTQNQYFNCTKNDFITAQIQFTTAAFV